MDYEVGQIVRIIKRLEGNTTGHPPKCYEPNAFVGRVGSICEVLISPKRYQVKDGEAYLGIFSDEELELVSDKEQVAADPWDNLVPSETVIIDQFGDNRLVLASLPGVFLLSLFNEYDTAESWYTVREAANKGFKIKGAEFVEKTIEVSGRKTAAELRKLADELEAGDE